MTVGKATAIYKAIQNASVRELLASVIIPHWGGLLGANWGYDPYGKMDNRSQVHWWTRLDYASLSHDNNTARAQQYRTSMEPVHKGWINEVWGGRGAEPGLTGQAIRLIGTPAFYLFSQLDPGT